MTDPDDDLTLPADDDLLAALRAELDAEDATASQVVAPTTAWTDESDPTRPARQIAEPELLVASENRHLAGPSNVWSLPMRGIREPGEAALSTVAISKRRTRVFFAATAVVVLVTVLVIAAFIVWTTQ